MSVMAKAPIAIGISLAVNATHDEVNEAIDHIRRIFGLTAAPGVAPAAAAAAQSITPITDSTNTGNIEFDSAGVPWDERIHSGAKSKKNDGTWTKRKGVADALHTSVTAELLAARGAAGPVGAAPALPATPGVAVVPSLPTLPQAGPVVPALPNLAPTAYQNFVAFIGTQLHSTTNPTGRINAAWVDQVIEGAGVPGGLVNLATREDLIPAIEAQIKTALGIA